MNLHPPAPSAAAPRRTGAPGVLVRLWEHPGADARRNQVWDQLLALAERAWTWRDPESIEQFEDCLLRLSLAVEADWS